MPTGRLRSLRFTPLLLLTALLATPPAAGTSVERLGEDQLIDAATLIVVATCHGTTTEHRGRRLVTHARVEVEQALKGHSRGRLTVVLPGGVDHNAVPPVAEVWPGAPTLATGERAVLYLRPGSERGTWTVVGFNQGKVSLAPTAADDDSLAALAARVRNRVASTAGTEVAP
ncbi:MAG TPA: hypothetical protein VKU40_14530 [Thermoanaerobaculia bacterium]|nr:hypothetical protein [Thermoanaerobaculia bacterium]